MNLINSVKKLSNPPPPLYTTCTKRAQSCFFFYQLKVFFIIILSHRKKKSKKLLKAPYCHYHTITLNTGASQGCVLSPVLSILNTQDCMATHSSYSVKSADDMLVLSFISNSKETAFMKEVENLDKWF